MGLVTKPHTFTASTTALSSEVNANFDTLYTLVNGNIEAANIASGAVGEAELAASAVTNAKVSATAAIALSKLAALTASRATETDASGVVTASAITSTELGYLSGVTSAIQTQINTHNSNTTNPHSVTAAQAGALATDNGVKIYLGRVSSAGAISNAPSGWTSSQDSTGRYTVTHNLNTTSYLILLTANMGAGITRIVYHTSEALNSFGIASDDETGAASNSSFHFALITR
jgi:hypothetical protein